MKKHFFSFGMHKMLRSMVKGLMPLQIDDEPSDGGKVITNKDVDDVLYKYFNSDQPESSITIKYIVQIENRDKYSDTIHVTLTIDNKTYNAQLGSNESAVEFELNLNGKKQFLVSISFNSDEEDAKLYDVFNNNSVIDTFKGKYRIAKFYFNTDVSGIASATPFTPGPVWPPSK